MVGRGEVLFSQQPHGMGSSGGTAPPRPVGALETSNCWNNNMEICYVAMLERPVMSHVLTGGGPYCSISPRGVLDNAVSHC